MTRFFKPKTICKMKGHKYHNTTGETDWYKSFLIDKKLTKKDWLYKKPEYLKNDHQVEMDCQRCNKHIVVNFRI